MSSKHLCRPRYPCVSWRRAREIEQLPRWENMAAMLTGFTFHWATYILLYSLDKPLQLVDGGLGIKPCPIPGRRASSISLATIIIWHLRSLGLFITYSHICTLPASCMTRGTAASVNPESTTFRPHKLTRLATFIPASVTDHHPLPPLTSSHNTCHPPRRPVLRSPPPPPRASEAVSSFGLTKHWRRAGSHTSPSPRRLLTGAI